LDLLTRHLNIFTALCLFLLSPMSCGPKDNSSSNGLTESTTTSASKSETLSSTQSSISISHVNLPAEKAIGSNIVGDLRIHRAFQSAIMRNNRSIRVWLPPGYEADVDKRYPVLYMMDGQNLFDASTSFAGEWHIDRTMTRLIEEKQIEPMIVVGIDNAGAARASEYTSVQEPRYEGRIVPQGTEFTRMLMEEIVPMIEGVYRTRATGEAHRGDTSIGEAQRGDARYIGGSSLGGLISIDIARNHPGQFAGVIAMSTSLWWNNGWMVDQLAKNAVAMKSIRVWLDFGTAEDADPKSQAYSLSLVRRLTMILRAGGVTCEYLEVPGGQHNEAAWAKRFDAAVLFVTKK